jgi:hypothetical protein
MYEGTPDTPARDRWWQIIEKYKVNILYTAPTTIRTFMKWGEDLPAGHDLSSLRLLGSVGEPINPEAWIWYRTHIGGRPLPHRRHLVADRDRGHPDHPAAGHHRHQAGAAMTPFPGIASTSSTTRATRSATTRAATWSSPSRGPACCGASTATTSATRRPTGRASPAATSPATGPSATRTATSGCSAGSTT